MLEWESALMNSAIDVDESLVLEVQRAVDSLPELIPIVADELAESPTEPSESNRGLSEQPGVWLPSSRYPEYLYQAYINRTDNISTEAARAAYADLAMLEPPNGLADTQFNL